MRASQSVKLYQASRKIDAFSDVPFGGNQAAVCLIPPSQAIDFTDELRQAIASENNLSETAYVEPLQEEGGDFKTCTRYTLRWFTPAIEVPLCGHATLAAAAALFFGESNPADTLFFETKSGELTVSRSKMFPNLLSMTLPALPASRTNVPKGMELGSELVHGAVSELPVDEILYCETLKYLVIVLQRQEEASMAAFAGLKPDVAMMHRAHSDGQLVGVIVTLQGDGKSPHDFYSRFFGPWAGIEEDPVTGSAHSVLGPYWAERLGKGTLKARQCSKRGGELLVEVGGDRTVEITGSATIVIEGQLYYK